MLLAENLVHGVQCILIRNGLSGCYEIILNERTEKRLNYTRTGPKFTESKI